MSHKDTKPTNVYSDQLIWMMGGMMSRNRLYDALCIKLIQLCTFKGMNFSIYKNPLHDTLSHKKITYLYVQHINSVIF